MRKMQDYIVKGKKVFVGLEDSKRSWKLTVRSERMVVHEPTMPTVYENLVNYLKGRYPGCEIKLMYEAGFGGFWLHDRLEADGIDCIVTPPSKVTDEKVNKVKVDRKDARRLAKTLENEDYKSCFVPDKELREDRQISRALVAVQKDITAWMNRVRKFFDFHGLNGLFPSGEWKISDYKRSRKVQLSEPLQVTLGIYFSIIDSLNNHKKALKRRLYALRNKDRYRKTFELFESAPGVGWLTAIRLVLEWGDRIKERFKTGKQIACFTGLTSSEYSTGEEVRRGRITGQSRGFIRQWLVQCAWAAIRKDPVLLEKYNRVWRNSSSKKKAIVAVARKLAVRLWRLAVMDQPYCIGLVET